jgi:hypothetical protein
MKRVIPGFFMMGVMIFAFSSNTKSFSEPPMPKLDVNKMVLDVIKVIEDRDFDLYCRLFGKEKTEKQKSRFNDDLAGLDAKPYRKPYNLDKLRLFPEIGELPEWVTDASFEFHYLESNKRVELEARFILKDNTWIIEDIYPDIYYQSPRKLNEKKMESLSRNTSPAPPEGEKTLDAGLNEIVQRLVSDFKEKNWDSIKEYSWYRWYDKISILKKAGKEYGELMSQFPSIGPIPAPAIEVRTDLKGTLEGKEMRIYVVFKWEDNTLEINYIEVKY